MIKKALNSFKQNIPDNIKQKLRVIKPVKDDSRLIILLNNLGLKSHYYAYPPKIWDKIFGKMPTIISIKVPQIESLTHTDILLCDNVKKYYHEGKTKILYDLSTEAITFSEYPSIVLKNFHEILRDGKINASDVILLCSNANANHHYKDWASNNNLSDYNITMLGYDFYFYEYYWEVTNCHWLTKNKSLLVQHGYMTARDGVKRSKHFLCLNLRPRWHRAATLLHLMSENLLNKGYITYHGKEFADHDSVSTESETLEHIKLLKNSENLLSQYESLKMISPLTLDRDASKIRNDLWHRKPGEVEFLFPDIQASPNGKIDSYFEIVTETWFTDESASYITEKTIRPLLRLQPFIHIGTPFLLQKLKDKGFKTFAPFIDERYDTITDPHRRLEAIFKEITRLCQMSIDEIHQLYTELWPVLLHNFHHYLSNTLPQAKQEIKAQLFDKIRSIN